MFKGWNYHVHRIFPGKFEPSNLSRENFSREIGRTRDHNFEDYSGVMTLAGIASSRVTYLSR